MTTPSWFDPRAGALGALVMGSLVALVNAPHGAGAAATSAAKQAVYTFFFGGFIVQLCHSLASRPGPRAGVLAVAIVLPSIITAVLIVLVHGLRGTPEPMLSTAVVLAIGAPSFVILALRKRRELEGAAGRH